MWRKINEQPELSSLCDLLSIDTGQLVAWFRQVRMLAPGRLRGLQITRSEWADFGFLRSRWTENRLPCFAIVGNCGPLNMKMNPD